MIFWYYWWYLLYFLYWWFLKFVVGSGEIKMKNLATLYVINLRFLSMIWVFRLILICHFVSSSNGKQVQSCLGWLVQIDFLFLGQIDFQSVVVFWGFGGLVDSFFSVNRHYLLQFWYRCFCFVFPPHSAIVLHFAVCVVELQFLSLKRKWKSVRYFVGKFFPSSRGKNKIYLTNFCNKTLGIIHLLHNHDLGFSDPLPLLW